MQTADGQCIYTILIPYMIEFPTLWVLTGTTVNYQVLRASGQLGYQRTPTPLFPSFINSTRQVDGLPSITLIYHNACTQHRLSDYRDGSPCPPHRPSNFGPGLGARPSRRTSSTRACVLCVGTKRKPLRRYLYITLLSTRRPPCHCPASWRGASLASLFDQFHEALQSPASVQRYINRLASTPH